MELVKSGVTDMEEKVIHLINHISLTHLVHFINHTNLTQAYITYKSTYWFANPVNLGSLPN